MTNSFGAFERLADLKWLQSEADAIIVGTGEIWLKGYISTKPKPSPYNRQAVYGGYLSIELKGRAGTTRLYGPTSQHPGSFHGMASARIL